MNRTWWDNEAILRQFRAWLTETGDEFAFLNGDEADAQTELAAAPAEPLPQIGLLQLVESFTALRQEMKLGTKSTRGLHDTVQAAAEGLEAARRAFAAVEPKEEAAVRRAAVPLIEALAELDEALWRANAALQTMQRQLAETGAHRLQNLFEKETSRVPWWGRRFARRWRQRLQQRSTAVVNDLLAEGLAHLGEGYRLIQQRLERSMTQLGIARVPTAGARVDPATMTVVELVYESQAAAETVVEEVRPGYTWQGQIIRFAEVRATSSGQQT